MKSPDGVEDDSINSEGWFLSRKKGFEGAYVAGAFGPGISGSGYNGAGRQPVQSGDLCLSFRGHSGLFILGILTPPHAYSATCKIVMLGNAKAPQSDMIVH